MTTSSPVRKKFWIALLLTNLVALPIIFLLNQKILTFGPKDTPIPVYATLSPFSLISSENKNFSHTDLENRFWLVSFIFTRCPNQCPAMILKIKSLQKTLSRHSLGYLSISVDPAHDTPKKISEYSKKHGADSADWIFLTGEKSTVDRMMQEAHLGSSDEPSMHSLRFILLDSSKKVRGYYDYEDPEIGKKINRDLNLLRKEVV